MSGISRAYPPSAFQKAMAFVDGTNLFYRFEAEKISLAKNLSDYIKVFTGGRERVRNYMYTIQEHLNKHFAIHGKFLTEGIRVVLGKGVPTASGNVKEKGVDALLVADLVYHAAVKNYDYALLVTADTDFTNAIQRIEDFGCRSGILGIGFEPPEELKRASDDIRVVSVDQMKAGGWVKGY